MWFLWALTEINLKWERTAPTRRQCNRGQAIKMRVGTQSLTSTKSEKQSDRVHMRLYTSATTSIICASTLSRSTRRWNWMTRWSGKLFREKSWRSRRLTIHTSSKCTTWLRRVSRYVSSPTTFKVYLFTNTWSSNVQIGRSRKAYAGVSLSRLLKDLITYTRRESRTGTSN